MQMTAENIGIFRSYITKSNCAQKHEFSAKKKVEGRRFRWKKNESQVI